MPQMNQQRALPGCHKRLSAALHDGIGNFNGAALQPTHSESRQNLKDNGGSGGHGDGQAVLRVIIPSGRNLRNGKKPAS